MAKIPGPVKGPVDDNTSDSSEELTEREAQGLTPRKKSQNSKGLAIAVRRNQPARPFFKGKHYKVSIIIKQTLHLLTLFDGQGPASTQNLYSLREKAVDMSDMSSEHSSDSEDDSQTPEKLIVRSKPVKAVHGKPRQSKYQVSYSSKILAGITS